MFAMGTRINVKNFRVSIFQPCHTLLFWSVCIHVQTSVSGVLFGIFVGVTSALVLYMVYCVSPRRDMYRLLVSHVYLVKVPSSLSFL